MQNLGFEFNGKWIEPGVDFEYPVDMASEHENTGRPSRQEARAAALKALAIIKAIDEIMSHSDNPERHWAEISLALGLNSVNYRELTQAVIARRYKLTNVAISKSVRKFLKLANLVPAYDKSGHLNF